MGWRMAEDERGIVCRFYTSGRRHPLVIGNLQGVRIPPTTPAQLGVVVASVVVLLATRALWAHLGMVGNGLVLVGVPVGLWWFLRAVRIEGRAPWRAGLGWLQLVSSPRHGRRLGHPARPARGSRWSGRIWLGELPPPVAVAERLPRRPGRADPTDRWTRHARGKRRE